MRMLGVAVGVALILGGGALGAGALDQPSSDTKEAVRVVDEIPVTPMNLEIEYSSNSPMLVADPAEPLFVAMANRLDAPDFSCSLQVSGDGGRSWVTAQPVLKLPEGAEKCYAPEIAIDGDGRLYYLFVALDGGGNRPMGAFLTTSTDRGVTFSEPRQVLGPLRFGVRLAIDRERGTSGRIHLVWIDARSEPALGGFGPPPNPIVSAHSDDGGATFSDPVQVSDADRERVVAPALALSADGAVHVAYYDLGRDALDYQGLEGDVWEEPWSLVLASSSDGGQSFGTGSVIDDAIVPLERVMLVFTMAPPALVAAAGGLVCAAWGEARHGDGDVLARCSPDGGAKWRPVRRLNDDRLGNGIRQYLPRLALSPEGRIDAVFFDRRDDANNAENNVYLASSSDGGRSWGENHRISQESSHSRVGQQYVHASADGQYEIGARLGLLSEASHAVAAWPDSRHSEIGTTSQDLFSATVALPTAEPDQKARRLLGGSLSVAGVAVVVLALRARRPRSEPR